MHLSFIFYSYSASPSQEGWLAPIPCEPKTLPLTQVTATTLGHFKMHHTSHGQFKKPLSPIACLSLSSLQFHLPPPAACRCREGVRRNFASVHAAAQRLGKVPEMLSHTDFAEGGMDER